MPAPLALADAATRGALVALLLLLGAVLWRARARLGGAPLATVGAALAAGLVVQVVAGLPSVDQALPLRWLALPIGVSVANSMLFWLFACALFDEGFRLRSGHGLLWGLVVSIGAAAALFCGPAAPQGFFAADPLGWLAALKSGLPLGFGLLALWAAARHWRVDLVEGRRRVRVFVVAAGVLDTLAMVGARGLSSPGRVAPLAAWLDVLLLLLIVAVVALQLLRLGELGALLGTAPEPADLAREAPELPLAPAEPALEALPESAFGTASRVASRVASEGACAPPDSAEQALLQALERAMEAEQLFRDEALSVASLAAHLDVPEYRLRRAINQRLGFRNFNAFVNGYRLAAARLALADPQRRDQPVLAIALESGFGSIGPFNRAFKAASGLTPSEFRRGPLADS